MSTNRVLLAIPDQEVAARARALLEEVGDVEVVGGVTSSSQVITTLTDTEAGVVVLDEQLGPLPVMDLARDLNHRMPQVGVVLLAREQTAELLRTAMGAGIRQVVPLPLTMSEFHGGIMSTFEWSQAVSDRLERAATQPREQFSGRVIGLAGAKGGVGTTTLAVQLALALQRADRERSVCLVDLDLQTGDVRSYLDLTHRRSLSDLVDVATELTTGHLQDAMFTHASGLRVLLPPVHGEDGEDVDGRVTTRIIGGIRARFDVVVIDLGTVMTEATAAAAELTDELLVVTTPDVVALRGANRLLSLWQRLHVVSDTATVLLNQVSRDNEVTPQLAERVVRAPVLAATIPASFRDLEAATNTGVPDRISGGVRAAVEELLVELGRDRRPDPRDDGDQRSDSTVEARVAAGELGSISIDFVASLGTVAVVVLLLWQFVLSGYTLVLAQHAAREGAAAVAVQTPEGQVRDRVASDIPGSWRTSLDLADDITVGGDSVSVRLRVPLLAPGLGSPWHITTSAGTVVESHGGPTP